MSSGARIIPVVAMLLMAAATATAAQAGPNGTFGACSGEAERAICEWIAHCERNGGEPHRPIFSTSMTCCFESGACEAMPSGGEPVRSLTADVSPTPEDGAR